MKQKMVTATALVLLLTSVFASTPIASIAPAAPAAAQAPVTVLPNTPFQIYADHNGANTNEFRLEKTGGATQTKPVSALTNGVIQFDLPAGVPAGTHAFAVRAVRIIPQGQDVEGLSGTWKDTVVADQPFIKTIPVPLSGAPTLTVSQMKLYRENALIQTQPAVGPSVTFHVPGLPAGSAEFKYGAVFSAIETTELASPVTGATITVNATTQTTSPSISATPNPVTPGAPQTVTWSCTTNCGTIGKDWIGLFRAGQVVAGGDIWWPGSYLVTPGSGSFVRNAPTTAGNYVWAYCINDGYTCTAQFPFTVSTAPPVDGDCQGTWSVWTDPAWSSCVNGVQTRTLSQTFMVTQQPSGNGKPCPNPLTVTKVETRSCTVNVVSVTLIDTGSQTPVAGADPITEGAVLKLPSTQMVAFRVNSAVVAPVTITLQPGTTVTESAAPYAYPGDSGGVYIGMGLTTGSYSFTTVQSGGTTVLKFSVENPTTPPVLTAVPATTSCRWVLRATVPDTTTGWRAQWRENGVNVGTMDITSPYDRTFNYTPGISRNVDVVWSKTSTSAPTRTSEAIVLACPK